MDITKSAWVTDADRVSLAMPLTKIDKENRLVSGWATLDNLDQQNDVVTAEASVKAFARAAGNIREMHQPIAAGRMVDFKEDEFWDSHDKKFYRGIFVTAYVSKGAESTWQKVLDGTLTGFSIGGKILDSETQFVKDAGTDGASVRFVKDYNLDELSLVDNPANNKATLVSITKSAEGSVIKGIIAETVLENVLWCAEDGVAKSTKEESADCSVCGKTMQNIGWFESTENRAEKVKEVVEKFLNPAVETETSEGGVDVEKNATVTEEESAEVVETPEEVNPAEEVSAEAEEVEAPSEEVAEEPDFAKMLDGLKEAVETSLEKNRELTKEAVDSLEEKVTEISESLNNKTSELEKSLGQLSEKLDAVKENSADVEKRLKSFEDSTAIRKSGEVETPEPVTKAKGWSGAFLGIDNLK